MLHGLSEMGVEVPELREWAELSSESTTSLVNAMPSFPVVQPVIIVEPAAAATGKIGVNGDIFPPRPPHIPLCLPAFPPKHTYTYTPCISPDDAEGRSSVSTRKRKVEENRLLESALIKLHQAAVRTEMEQAQPR
jgi:hypothetical protein